MTWAGRCRVPRLQKKARCGDCAWSCDSLGGTRQTTAPGSSLAGCISGIAVKGKGPSPALAGSAKTGVIEVRTVFHTGTYPLPCWFNVARLFDSPSRPLFCEASTTIEDASLVLSVLFQH